MANIAKSKEARRKPWYVSYDFAGVRKRVFFKTKSEAEGFRREIEKLDLLRSLGLQNFQKQVLISQAMRDYLETCSVKKSGRSCYQENVWFKELLEYFTKLGLQNLSDIHPLHLEKYQMLQLQKIKATSVNRRFASIKNFFRKCEEWGFLEKNPCRLLKKLPEEQQTKKLWTPEQVRLFLELSEPWAKRIFYFLAQTGARPSSIERLKWKEVDFDQALMRLSTKKGNGRLIYYHFPLSEPLKDFLEELKVLARLEKRAKDTDSVFINASGEPISSMHIVRKAAQVIQRAKFDGLTLYGLRHTFITRAANLGGVHRASLLAGHRNLKTTQSYIHLSQEELQQTLKLVHSESWEKSS